MLEPCAGKLASSVLRGRSGSNATLLPDFVVQYETLIQNEWRAIIRYDTADGFAHKDIIHYNGQEEKQPLYFQDLNMAFTFAIQELKIFWSWYRAAYEKEIAK